MFVSPGPTEELCGSDLLYEATLVLRGSFSPWILHSFCGDWVGCTRYFPNGINQLRTVIYGKSQWITAQQAPLHSWHSAPTESGTSSQLTFHASCPHPPPTRRGTGTLSSFRMDEGQTVTPAAAPADGLL